ncbi:unnamed protein product [Paramecium octaurelia]|uniref:Uncharacterized protein n=1 Tax=Paramecium octaurelia TaxID=43137 RepID=A0A8S1Y2D3_PAROT|nr:unnamed protein product [Paramecium octaurelia]
MLQRIKIVRSLNQKLRYRYEQLSAELYFLNQRDCYGAKTPKSVKLKPLKAANQGYLANNHESSDTCYVTGVPYGQTKDKFQNYDLFNSLNTQMHPDLIVLQLDPSPYLARQRFLAHKCALQNVEGYEMYDTPLIDPLKPHAWEEAVVNLVVLDMLNANKNMEEIDWSKGLSTYSYANIQSKEIQEANKNLFIQTIDEHIINHRYSEYYLINRVLYTALMGKHKVLLADMPDHLHKLNLGGTLEIQEARDLFKYTLQKTKQMNDIPITLRKAAYDFLPHVFQTPKDLYMTGMLKSAFEGCETINAYVGIPHLVPINNYWVEAPHGINYTEATRIPPRRTGETDENQIEKMALLDVLLETHTWAEPYLSNPFPYIVEDLTQATAGDLKAMKECFLQYYQKYSAYKNELQKELPNLRNHDIKFIEQTRQAIPDMKYEKSIEIKALTNKQLQQRNVEIVQ